MNALSNKQSEAINAIFSDRHLKESFCKLRKYRKILEMPVPAYNADLHALVFGKLNREIERRKEKFWSIATPYLIGLAGALTASIICFFSYQIYQDYKKKGQQLPLEQPATNTTSKANLAKDKTDQLKNQKTK